MAAPPPLDEVRTIQGLAELLAPFAGKAAKTLATKLIGHFGSLGRALDAPRAELEAVAGPHIRACQLIRAARELMDNALRSDVAGAPVDSGSKPFLRYVRRRFLGVSGERLHVTFCDAGGRYLGDEMLARGTGTYVFANLRCLFARALALDASAIVLAHNHPSGVCRPSAEDVKATEKVRALGEALDVILIDHIIVTKNEFYSMKTGQANEY